MIESIILIATIAFLNRCRGSRFYELVDSTSITRFLATFLITACCSLYLGEWKVLLCWPLLFFWAVFGWGKYFAAATGHVHNPEEREFAPVDWLMKKLRLPTDDGVDAKLWGTIAMALRHSLIVPFIVACAIIAGNPFHGAIAALFPLMGVAYFAGGLISKERCIEIAEYVCGALIAIMIVGVS